MKLSPAAREYLLALADDEHFVGARHTNWIGLGPFLEEDLAFCSIAQDELGHAIGLYELVLDDPAELDAFAMMRAPEDYRSCWLAEIECSDWNDSLVRHWLYDRAEALRWEALAACSEPRVAALAARARREESFHLTHAEQLMSRVAATDDTGRIIDSIDRLLPVATAIWDPAAGESAAIEEAFVHVTSAELGARWADAVRDDLGRWGLAITWPAEQRISEQLAGQHHRTHRSRDFDVFQGALQRVLSIDPSATW